jgi:drug/metabolite transporter (DMT)-like permease
MPLRIRKLIGVFALFALVICWALIAMAVAQFPPIFNNPWIAAVYYAVAGIGWILPAMPLIRWMSKPDVRSR